jgi:hypothetical protein
MTRSRGVLWIVLVCLGLTGMGGLFHHTLVHAASSSSSACDGLDLDPLGSTALQTVTIPPTQTCAVQMKSGFPVPDPNCTPGAVNLTLTLDVLEDPDFRTSCVRNQATTLNEKSKTYEWYQLPRPADNHGTAQTCELDDQISLELGGADTLDNIGPQCGPDGVQLSERYFKQKDIVENYLAAQVKSGQMDLGAVQQGIAADWTQYLDDATKACPGGRCP